MRRQIYWDGRKDGRTDRGKTVYPLRWTGGIKTKNKTHGYDTADTSLTRGDKIILKYSSQKHLVWLNSNWVIGLKEIIYNHVRATNQGAFLVYILCFMSSGMKICWTEMIVCNPFIKRRHLIQRARRASGINPATTNNENRKWRENDTK